MKADVLNPEKLSELIVKWLEEDLRELGEALLKSQPETFRSIDHAVGTLIEWLFSEMPTYEPLEWVQSYLDDVPLDTEGSFDTAALRAAIMAAANLWLPAQIDTEADADEEKLAKAVKKLKHELLLVAKHYMKELRRRIIRDTENLARIATSSLLIDP